MEASDDRVWIGAQHAWGGDYPFSYTTSDRRHHTYIIGKTGTGKSTLLKNIIIQDILAGRGVGLIDPHGDLAEEILDFIPRRRAEDVVYFHPGDYDYPIAWNFLHADDPARKHLVASGIVAAMKNVWRDSWGPRLEYILYASIATLLECENTSILGVSRLLADPGYRARMLKQVRDPGLVLFWREFEAYDERFRVEAIAPIQNKVGQLLLARPVRNIFGQVKNKVSAKFMMDHRKIFLANLAKGTIGEDKANLLGALLLGAFQHAAMERVREPEAARVDFHLVIDEFQNFSTDATAEILSEARKYRLAMTLSHQYTAQLPQTVSDAVFGNVGTLISFRVGEADAAVLAREFGNEYSGAAFTALDNHEICVKLMQNGKQLAPFLGCTYAATWPRHERSAPIIRRSRERYATPRGAVEAKLARWIQSSPPPPAGRGARRGSQFGRPNW